MNYSKILNLLLALALLILLIKVNYFSSTKKENILNVSEQIDYSKGTFKNIGPEFSFLPTTVVVAGTEVENKVNWITMSNVGYMGMNNIFVGSRKVHYSNIGIKKNMTISVSLVSESMLPKTDYVGMKSGKDVDKSEVFEYFKGELTGAPLIKEAPVTMECKVVKILDVGLYDYFVLEVVNTYVNESILNKKSKIDYNKFHPLLFEMGTMKYIETGKPVGNGFKEAEKYKKD